MHPLTSRSRSRGDMAKTYRTVRRGVPAHPKCEEDADVSETSNHPVRFPATGTHLYAAMVACHYFCRGCADRYAGFAALTWLRLPSERINQGKTMRWVIWKTVKKWCARRDSNSRPSGS